MHSETSLKLICKGKTMEKFIGKGVYPSVAIGKISVLEKDSFISNIQPSGEKNNNYSDELKKYENAKEMAVAQLKAIYEKALSETGEEAARIFDIHIMLIDDEDLNESVIAMLEEGYSAEYSVAETGRIFSDSFAAMDDDYMRESVREQMLNRLIAWSTRVV